MSADIRGSATAGLEAKARLEATAGLAADGDLTPGEHLRAEIERLGLDQVAVSEATDVSRQSINNIVNGRQPISRAMAGKLGRLTGHSSDYWLRASFARNPAPKKTAGRTERKDEPARLRPLGVAVMVNHQIVRAIKDGIIGIDPFDESNVQPASIDLSLDDFLVTTEGEKVDISDRAFVLKGGQTVSVSTKEYLEFPRDYFARVGGMASLGRIGILVSHGFQVDPGFRGSLQFCVFNAGFKNFELRSGMPIVSLEIMALAATPAPDDRADRRLRLAADRGAVISLLQSDVCDRLIRDDIRGRAKVEVRNDGAEAKIPELGIEVYNSSADSALDGAVDSALAGLQALRANPNAARNDREKYLPFFSDLAGRLYLTADQARQAIARLGFPTGGSDTLIATLRDGQDAMLSLPTRSAKISLRHLARQLREDPTDLILILAGISGAANLKS